MKLDVPINSGWGVKTGQAHSKMNDTMYPFVAGVLNQKPVLKHVPSAVYIPPAMSLGTKCGMSHRNTGPRRFAVCDKIGGGD